jgi:hypothetical protein
MPHAQSFIPLADVDTFDQQPQTIGRFALDLLSSDPRISATAIQTVGSKGYDGLALAVMTADP